MTGSSQLDTTRVDGVGHQAFFRDVNDRIAGLSRRLAGKTQYVCECREAQCTAPVSLSIDEYDAIRTDPQCFFVHPSHGEDDLEGLVASNEHYAVVRRIPLD